ncbi:redoxin domain-containing protein [Robertkochia flava]|uniref:redoxin domain-containing protein n=1 Tax=Robertkochia flava TaxID=3447986 RepID=UPI001CC94E11|nr:redoxin domain-containing protein [Robertkochia marina]
MKKILSIFGFLLLFASCSETAKNSFTLNIKAEGIADSTKVFIQKLSPAAQGEIIDTLEIMNETATLSGTAAQPGFHALIIENVRGGLPFILEEGNIEITAYKDSINRSLVEGTPTNADISNYTDATEELGKRYNDIMGQMRDASMKGDTVTLNVMRETMMELQEDASGMEYQFAKDNPSSFFSVILMNNMLRTQSQPIDSVSKLYNALDENLKTSDFGKFVSESIEANNKVKIGAKAPEFSAPTPEGGELALNEILGKVTIIDFWAAWCKPCRVENPNMVKLYEEYHDKGLNVIGVSLDATKDAWVKAIEEDGLPWHQVSHLQRGNDPIARMYNVNSIPATFVLDENGVIVAKGLRGEELYNKIAEMLP